MCGLVCAITKSKYGFSYKDMEIFENLLFIDTLRGPDSTGVFLVTNDGNVEIAKGAVDGPTYVKSDEWKELKKKAISDGWAIVGHNRKATRGSITDENAHPFWVDDKLVLVHNGSMYGDHKKHKDVEVDSHAIAHVLAETPDIEEALQKINAAYAFIWYDVEKKNLHVIRNNERPLAHTSNHNAWYITSETGILDFVMQRQETNWKKDAVNFPVGNLHTWTLNSDKGSTLAYKDVDHKYRFHNTGTVPWDDNDNGACAYGTSWASRAIYGSHGREVIPAQYVDRSEVENSSVLVLDPNPPELDYYLGLNRIPDWQQPINYSAVMALRNGHFRNNSVHRCVVDDIIAYPGYTNGDFIFVGQLVSAELQDVPVVFRVTKAVAEAAMAGDDNTKRPVFYVNIANHAWKNIIDSKGQGYLTLWGEKASLLVQRSVASVVQEQQQQQHSVH